MLNVNRRPFPFCYDLAAPVGHTCVYMYCQNVSMVMDLKKRALAVKQVNYALHKYEDFSQNYFT